MGNYPPDRYRNRPTQRKQSNPDSTKYRCEIEVAYAIGVAHPLSLLVETFGTEKIDRQKIEKMVKEHFDLRPAAIIKDLNLRKPIYTKTACYGHFGRTDKDFSWERVDKADILKKEAGL